MCPSGRYSRLEIAGAADLRPAFDVLDADHDGKISGDDLKAFYSGLPSSSSSDNPTDDDISSMIAAAAVPGHDGFVGLGEFERVIGCTRSTAVMEEAFKVMDKDGDGSVGFEDLKSYLSWAGLPARDEEIRSMIKMGGGDETGGVCFEGLLKILTVDFSGDY